MARKLGVYSWLFWGTLVLCGAWLGGWIGSSSARSADAVFPLVILAALGGAVVLALIAAFAGLAAFGTGIIDNERQARIIVLSVWGTIVTLVLVGTIIEFVAMGTVLLLTPLEIVFGLIFGVEIAAEVYSPESPKKCQDGAA